ncbi:hypothetical protein [Streptomyces thermolilacinus]|uniref:hypothetical protein n=1 Tax=Streptomyces thermolilacinus TaxID=285540 RepID=UPI003F4D654D
MPVPPCARAGERLGVLVAWGDTELFTDRERPALALVEAVAHPAVVGLRSAAHGEARAVLADDENSAAIWVAITIKAFSRLSVLSGHPVRPPAPGRGMTSSRVGVPPACVPARLEGGGVVRTGPGRRESEGRPFR